MSEKETFDERDDDNSVKILSRLKEKKDSYKIEKNILSLVLLISIKHTRDEVELS